MPLRLDGTGSNNSDEDFYRDEQFLKRNRVESDLETQQRIESEQAETWKQEKPEDLEQE